MPNVFQPMEEKELEKVNGGAYNGSVFLYTFQPGDNLSVLAHRFGTTVAILRELNNIRTPESLVPGLKLLIPLKG